MREMKGFPVEMMPSATTRKEWPGTGREGKGRAVSLPASCEIAHVDAESEGGTEGFDPLSSLGVIKTFSIFR